MELAGIDRDRALASWRRASGDDLVKYQTLYNAMQTLIDLVKNKPVEFSRPTSSRPV